MVWEEMSFEEFQDGHHGDHLEYQNRTILAILNLLCHCVSSFGSIQLTVWEMSFEEFHIGHRGGHLGYWNGTILAILNLCVTLRPPIKFQLNQTWGLGGDVI